MLNYACPPRLLERLVPAGTELDDWHGESLISLVGFMFRQTRVLGFSVPGHRDFEEVNLRFYVRRTTGGEVRRGVVFIRELVPRPAIAGVARWRYNEPYLSVPMRHSVALDAASGGEARYEWSFQDQEYALWAAARGPARALEPGTKAEFITEHYWGYNRQRDGATLEYEVEHPRWLVWGPEDFGFRGDARALYGSGLGEVVSREPDSAFLALGSEVTVHRGRVVVDRPRQ